MSPLLFPKRPYHFLLKDDKLQTDQLNNPLNDAKKAKRLFLDELEAFRNLPKDLKKIYYLLLKDTIEFDAFFKYIDYKEYTTSLNIEINKFFNNKICGNVNLNQIINKSPIELAYCLALICKYTYINSHYKER